ncbi:MAG: hypothetical protein A3B91_02720 [Candidatus Yanofskybacteria bacterium RIFCSPHIGHO2_02_FULL_41_29]|uniref:quinolinate synthase n=1 Tax=Candidatus Yanofskybacteria bacterium RIFCSPHIGHO2_01_FULL_41_53 TaxID=1802663 RepID=A0A1F8EK05_9BACT|nr:MAG: hypothetical protein A2650_00480 [Candidatus Yanofskybacteria bacterium RIFCSPHIGHO2_01_FULL_41_53]OGN10779.1 MAG: hypothetical protein A3B91_02720 [Candidatus Yanofskybacteria bacterium RIFCSPHIGHO2_02_FULL_41_29]OGN17070.1 MAG: hypothetical protein A3F48_03930 [Candidatus Yanofskybacteria bacterium RIFCSPHIGHO2_12_FULL_41_9]OGN21800.1 MAG: hypothetical protein A2916_01285 [Candidatus Yanofskybacteria bacterium RIFCSPLOWO2_01_FULL_41_67]OGN29414.1 MAG: hypothetical protein A3H54_04120 
MRKSIGEVTAMFYDSCSRFAEDLYPGRYSFAKCRELTEQADEMQNLAKENGSIFLAHYYTTPEFHELADKLGDSWALSQYARDIKAPRVYFIAVAFMGQTAKMITGDQSRIFIPDTPKVLGCSLVFGTDHIWIQNWRKDNPGGIIVAYINSDPYTKALTSYSNGYISTSRNTDKIIAHAVKNNPSRKVLVLPDKFLGIVMKKRAIQLLEKNGIKVNPDLIEIYDQPFNGYNACCYVHEKLGNDSILVAMTEHPDAELMIHPECGCSSFCLMQVEEGNIPHGKAFFLSTEQMIQRAIASPAKKFLVATEAGLIYALRTRLPDKTFIPVSANAHCDFMKGNTFEKLLRSLREDRLEIVICDNCPKCLDPLNPYEDDQVIHIPRRIAQSAKESIDKMLTIV